MQKQAAIQPLIDVNRILMRGLSAQMSTTSQAGDPAPLAQSA
ncbi:MAG TPA: hypothetical protein VGM25_16125 [Caulobacteraceae bacterium]|jgi:hypothetical protein